MHFFLKVSVGLDQMQPKPTIELAQLKAVLRKVSRKNVMSAMIQSVLVKQTLISFMKLVTQVTVFLKFLLLKKIRGTQRQFSENIYSGDDLRSTIFGTFVVKFLACLPLLGFSNI